MRGGLQNKIALVTGGALGIGRVCAFTFAREGARVVVADIDSEGGTKTAQTISKNGGQAFFVRTDVCKADQVKALIDRIVDIHGRLDCAHNNAGIEGNMAATADCTEANWDRVIDINLKGVWLCMKYQIPQMIRQGGGTIVNTSSIGGLVGVQNLPAYVASKHGVVGLTKSAALEYAKRGIRINAVCPGFIEGALVERLAGGDPKIIAQFISRYPLGRMGTPEEIAEVVVWLCSDAASFITGHALAVDGGRIAG
jgi:NAD(P)-dependent dehydrogenase (short-subunit alcohol dehydrogenase family)